MAERFLTTNIKNVTFDLVDLYLTMSTRHIMYDQEYISIESMQLPETAFLHIDVTSSSANPISGGVVV